MTIRGSLLVTVLSGIIILLNGCGGEDEKGGVATLSWNPVISSSPISYTVHYGKQSIANPGACNYEHSVDVQEPHATITSLDLDTDYYFAVSAFNGARSLCSAEVSKRTSPLAVR